MSNETIKKVYEDLDRVTPLKKDCGRICNRKCCQGSDSDGMLLFPGEEEIFLSDDKFVVYFDERYGYNCVRCSGACDRNKRPISCRIFPYFIYFKNIVTVAPDIRAKDFCPLLKKDIKIDKQFLRALRIAAKRMNADEEICSFLSDITEKLTDFNDL